MILSFEQVSAEDLGRVGGKGLNLGRLSRAGFPVPPGFCITTEGFRAFTAGCAEIEALYAALDALGAEDVAAARIVGARVREALSAVPLPASVAAPALSAWERIGQGHAYAVRSSATAEDLPGASFAGQQDTYLNVRGEEALLSAIKRCFISLFTDRAILYRAQGGFGHRGVSLSVVVQRMVLPDAAGILFTADPVSGHRGTLTIDAGFGLGEALVSGLVTADLYRVDKRSGRVLEARIGDKALAIRPLPEGGTREEPLPEAQRKARVLSDAQVEALTRLGARVEAHYGGVPQDLEWCIEGAQIFLLQARPVTSLFPLPEPESDGALHVYFSFGHAQNMTDPISPLGQDVLRALLPFGKESLGDASADASALKSAGGRLYMDVTRALTLGPTRRLLGSMLGTVYPDLGRAIELLADRKEVQAAGPPSIASVGLIARLLGQVPPQVLAQLLWGEPEEVPAWADALVEEMSAAMAARLQAAKAGAPRLREARQAMTNLIPTVTSSGLPRQLISGMVSLGLLRRRFAGTPHAEDVERLQRGLVGNVTTEMDLQVGDLSDLARPWPELCEALRRKAPREELAAVAGGPEFLAALDRFLKRFGMRGQGEIDIARGRWADEPALLYQVVIGGLLRKEPGEHRAHFRRQQAEGEAAGQRLVAAAGDPVSRRWVAKLVRCVRYGLGVREHPKYLLIRCMGLLREQVQAAARELVGRGRLADNDDVWLLRFEELLSQMDDPQARDMREVVAARRADYERYRHLSPPLAFTSEGEIPHLPPPADLPPGALSGLGASAGVVEGTARVVLDPAAEVLHAGEILIAPYTDPGWTPLFVHAAGLVCDVGGMMTHGSVVAREYGIPAVVGVGNGTRKLKTGQRIRVDGIRGLVEVLAEPPSGDAA